MDEVEKHNPQNRTGCKKGSREAWEECTVYSAKASEITLGEDSLSQVGATGDEAQCLMVKFSSPSECAAFFRIVDAQLGSADSCE